MRFIAALIFCLLIVVPNAVRADELAAVKVANVSWPSNGRIDFVKHVQPILQTSCVECHSADNKKGRLRLDAKAFAAAGGQSGEIFAAGKSKDSTLIRRINGAGGEKQMPFKRPALPEEQIKILTAWIDQGAIWPDGVDGVVKEDKQHWAFVKPVRHEAPAVKQSGWVRNPIDAFVLARLENEGLAPSPEADKAALVRRVTLDLIGLPPTLAEIDAFIADTSSNAYERLVDRLLTSPHYGERWARQWLDIARYADTNGYEKDRPRNIYPYRDWVISALNRDMPFNQFTIEQIAGDMLPSATPAQITATGFHRNTLINEEGGIDVEEFRFKAMVDRVETTSSGWLGLTLQCAQCHNHKYDPVTQKEYYRLFSMLNNADEPEYEIPDQAIAARRADVESQIAKIEANLANEFLADEQDTKWSPLKVVNPVASSRAALNVFDDGTVLASKKSKATDSYTFQVQGDLAGVTSLRLEALTDSSLPHSGPGRAVNGNFVISEFKAVGTSPLKFVAASADFSQANMDVSLAIDGDPNTGWAIDDLSGNLNKPRTASFQLADPIAAGLASLTITIDQNLPKHALGKFRLSAGRPAGPTLVSAEPLDVRRAKRLAKHLEEWTQQAAAKAGRWTIVRPAKMTSRGHATMDTQPDGSVLVSGDWPNNDVYTVELSSELSGITGIKLEVLPDHSLAEDGPGRAPLFKPGDFMLSEVEIQAGAANDAKLETIKPSGTSHSFASAGASAELTLDGRADTGWQIGPRTGQAHQATYMLPKAVGGAGGTKLVVTLSQLSIHQMTIGRFRLSVTTDVQPAKASEMPSDVEAILASMPTARTADRLARLKNYYLSITPELAGQQQRIAQLRKSKPQYQRTMVMKERPAEHPRITHLLHRGEFLQPREEVTGDVPPILHPLAAGLPGNRLGLAKWLVDDNNPLVGRVVMNRAWMSFFGRGIVNTPGDFGLMGEPPSHPELLDWLATEFINQKWSLKAMHRLVATSATYRQSGRVTPELLAKDAGNVLLARGPRTRVEAEMVRDLALSVSGLFDGRVGGPSVYPPQPDGVSELSYGSTPWPTSTGGDRWRRGLYTYLKRTSPYPAMLTFDAPNGDTTCVRRVKSNTPMQALTLLNDKVFVETSQALARRVLKDAPADNVARIKLAFQICTGREAAPDELAELKSFYDAQADRFATGKADAAAVASSEALPASKDANLPELAAWTVMSRVLLNLDETITK